MEQASTPPAISLPNGSVSAQKSWHIVPVNSKLTFTATHLGIADVAGLFKTFEVTATTSQSNFCDAVFDLSADVASINAEVEMRDNHLKSPDFFDVEKFPKLTFKSTVIKEVSKDKYILIGNLTLHGITKLVTLDLWYRGTTYDRVTKGDLAGFQLTGSLNRSDFNIGSAFPPPMVSDKVSIKADGEFQAK